MQYGVDIASTRLDDLDKRVIAKVREMVDGGVRPRVLDVGCGQGGLSLALATAGATVVALDIDDYRDAIYGQFAMPSDAINFIQADIRDWVATNTERFDLVVLQRVLHYLHFDEAVTVLTALRTRTKKLYVAVSGLTTAIGAHYEARTMPIEKRWGKLDTAGQALFSITAPLCLYTEGEVRTLFAETGWEITWLRVSDFGNIKVEAVKRE